MALKRKSIIQPKVKHTKKYNKALSTIRTRLDALKPQQPGNGMIHLDPREWNGGFDQPPVQQLEDVYNKQAKYQPPVDAMKNQLQALLQQKRFQKPQPGGPQDGMISLDPREWNGGFDNQMNRGKELFERELQNQYVPGEVRGQGQVAEQAQYQPHQPYQPPAPGAMQRQTPYGGFKESIQLPQLPPRADPGRIMQQLKPTHDGGGMIRLDPREWGGNGGFNQMPKLPNPPMKQQPVQMPGKPMPMPGLGGGMPPQGPKQMPMPNPKRNLIPRPINPRYKMM